jgi:ketosteroid isomerase-like protein
VTSHHGADLVREMHRAFLDQDLDRFLTLLDPDIEVVPIVGSELDGMVYRGHAGVRDWWDHFRAVFRNVEVSLDEVRDLGDRVIAASRFQSEGPEGGVQPELTVWTVSEVRNDKIVSWRSFRSEGEALGVIA